MFRLMTLLGIGLLLFVSSGCCMCPCVERLPPVNIIPPQASAPRELTKITLPTYTIEAPDILTIEAVRIVPKAPYRINTLDVLILQVQGTLPDAPISGPYTVEPGGTVNFGAPYGIVTLANLTIPEATEKIRAHLQKDFLREPVVSLTLGSLASRQEISGQHLVAPDGTVQLGTYGNVYVVGLTLAQAKIAIETHLSRYLENPEISVDVFAYNSRVYYVITQGGGLGDQVTRFPVTGNETVLDAISQVNGLNSVSSKKIWVARPASHPAQEQILPVDWNSIAGRGSATTNYQVMPGDRIFIAEDNLVAFDNNLGKIIAPFERIFGFALLGRNTVSQFATSLQQNSNTNGGGNFP